VELLLEYGIDWTPWNTKVRSRKSFYNIRSMGRFAGIGRVLSFAHPIGLQGCWSFADLFSTASRALSK
jgi:hypothetical protein